MDVLQMVLIALFIYLGSIGSIVGNTIGWYTLGRPLPAAFVVGLILGDVQTAMIVGLPLQVMYLGNVTPGGAVAWDLSYATYIGTAGAIVFGEGLDASALIGIATVFAGIGVATCVVTILAAIVLNRPPSDIVAVMLPGKSQASGYDPADEDAPLKTPSFYVYWLWAAIVIAIGLATIGNCASDAQQVGIDVGFATLLVGLVSTCNGLARVVVGAIFDRTNVKVTMVVDTIAGVCATLCIVGAFATGIHALYIVGAFCCGFCYGGVPVVTSAFARQRFGSKNYPLNLSIGNFAIVFGSLINVALQMIIGAGARSTVFTVLAVMSVIALVVIAVFARMWKSDMKSLEERRAAASDC